jgi:hypothetical protein
VPELKLPVGLKLLAGEDGTGGWASSPEELRCGLKLFCCGSGGAVRVDGRSVEETFPLISRSRRSETHQFFSVLFVLYRLHSAW